MTTRTLDLLSTNIVRFATSSLINYQPVRNRNWTNVRPIMGWPRKHLANKGKKYPEAHTYNWLPYLPSDGQYTTRPLPILKLGGRDLESGHVVVRTLGGGNVKKFRWVDHFKTANDDGTPREERVLLIKYDPLSTPNIALVADAERKRWVLATDGLKVGDIITTYSEIPRNPIRAKDGDAHPIGALPVGTHVNQIETEPGAGSKFCLVAGSSGTITKRSTDSSVVKLPSGDSIKLDRECMVVVGKLSNVGHINVQLMCPQRLRWLGKRPRSGQWHRKDGYCGRKIYPAKLLDLTTAALEAKASKEKEFDMFDLS